VDAVRHDQIALDSPGKCRGRVLTVAQKALLGGLAWMLTCHENLFVTAATLVWRDVGQEVGAALMFPMARGTLLLHSGMVRPQHHRPMTIKALLWGYAGPGLVTAGTTLLQGRMRSGQRSIHEDPLIPAQAGPGQQGAHHDGTAKHRNNRRANGIHLSAGHRTAGHIRRCGYCHGDRGRYV
jgi:hypothetical protein